MKKYINLKIVIVIIIMIVNVFRLFQAGSSGFTDESLYLTGAVQLYKGDAWLVDTWKPVHIIAVLILPIIAPFIEVTGGTDGIMIYVKIVYLITKCVACTYVYFRLRRNNRNEWLSFLAVLIFFSFSPANSDVFSTNTIPLITIFVVIALLITGLNSWREYLITGVLCGIATIGQPFLFILDIFILVLLILTSRRKHIEYIYIYILGGIVVACTVGIFLLSRASVEDIINNIPYILNEGGHDITSGNLFVILLKRLYAPVLYYKPVTFSNIIAIVLIVIIKDEKKYFSFASIAFGISFVYMLVVSWNGWTENMIFLPFGWLSLEIVLVLLKKNKYVDIIPFLAHYAYICSICIGTNTGDLFVYTMATSVLLDCIYADVAFEDSFRIKSFGSDSDLDKVGFSQKLFILMMSFVLVTSTVIHFTHVWYGNIPLSEHNVFISSGPLKGMYTTSEYSEKYETALKEIHSANLTADDVVLFMGTPSFLILNTDADICYGQYGSYEAYDEERLNKYLDMHPDKYPTVIYFYNGATLYYDWKIYQELSKNADVIMYDGRLVINR